MGQLSHAGIYLVQTLVSLYLLAVLLRFFLQLVRADFYNPVSQFVVKVTDPLLRPLRRVIPGFAGVDLAALLLALLVQGLAIALILSLAGAPLPNPLLILLWSLVGLLGLTIKIFFIALLLTIILSWVAPMSHHPLADLLLQLTEPVMAPVRRIIPPIGGLDLSPIFVFIGINLLEMLVVDSLVTLLAMPRGLVLGL